MHFIFKPTAVFQSSITLLGDTEGLLDEAAEEVGTFALLRDERDSRDEVTGRAFPE